MEKRTQYKKEDKALTLTKEKRGRSQGDKRREWNVEQNYAGKRDIKRRRSSKARGLQTLEEMDVTARMVAVNARGNEKQRWKTLDTPTAQH